MNKKLKTPIMLLVIVFILSFWAAEGSIVTQAVSKPKVNIILDALTYNNKLPNHFRKTTDLSSIKNNSKLNLKGLSSLNISGSQQFSEKNLPILIKAIGTKLPITMVDLRQESHGLINGYAVSWADSNNNANVGLSRKQVLKAEADKLKSIRLGKKLTFYNESKKTIVPKKVKNEESIVNAEKLHYLRITVRDNGVPTDDMVDYYIKFIKNKPKASWLHFHCKAGIGRTTTFMIMYDMMKNYNKVSAADIINRQVALANLNQKWLNYFNNAERINFLYKFYDYCKANGASFDKTWSEWKQEDNVQN